MPTGTVVSRGYLAAVDGVRGRVRAAFERSAYVFVDGGPALVLHAAGRDHTPTSLCPASWPAARSAIAVGDRVVGRAGHLKVGELVLDVRGARGVAGGAVARHGHAPRRPGAPSPARAARREPPDRRAAARPGGRARPARRGAGREPRRGAHRPRSGADPVGRRRARRPARRAAPARARRRRVARAARPRGGSAAASHRRHLGALPAPRRGRPRRRAADRAVRCARGERARVEPAAARHATGATSAADAPPVRRYQRCAIEPPPPRSLRRGDLRRRRAARRRERRSPGRGRRIEAVAA